MPVGLGRRRAGDIDTDRDRGSDRAPIDLEPIAQRVREAGEDRDELAGELDVLEPLGAATCVHVRTDAAFPGRAGWVYRALVVASGAHGAVVRRILRGIHLAGGVLTGAGFGMIRARCRPSPGPGGLPPPRR